MWGTTRTLSISLNESSPIVSFASVIYGGSISGAQKKGMFGLNKSTGRLKAQAKGSAYILKPNGDYPELPENEHITMAIAKKVGFQVPPFVLLEVEGLGSVFAIKRFDREIKGDTPIHYLQEDMGQIIGIQSSDKYHSSCEQVAKAIKSYSSTPIVDVAKYFERMLFCFLTANADMHLKNWSMLELPSMQNLFGLSPVYDFLNTRIAIPTEPIDIGLPIRGKSRNLQRSYFLSFADEIGIEKRIKDQILQTAETWKDIAVPMIQNSLLSNNYKTSYLKIMEERHRILFG